MKCLIIVPSLMRAGAQTQAVDLANGLSLCGHEVHLCTFAPQLDQKGRLADSVRFHHVRRKSKYDLSLVPAIAEIIDRERIDVIQGVLQFAVLIAWLASGQSDRHPPVIAAIHTTINQGLKQELQDRLLYRRILRRLPAVVFVCNHQRDYWIRKYPEMLPLARVVHNGVDVNRFRRRDFAALAARLRVDLAIPADAFVFTSIAGFRPEKGHRVLIQAFKSLPSNTYLILAGDGLERPVIEAAVHKSEIADRVRFLGNISDVRPAIVASEATVLASTAVETFSLAMLESMALEVPMVASTIGGLPEAIIHGETGLLCRPGDSQSLAAQMRFLVEHPAETQKLGRAAAERVARFFTIEKMVTRNEAVLASVLLPTGRPPTLGT